MLLRFVEDTCGLERIGDHAFEKSPGSLPRLLDLAHRAWVDTLVLDPCPGAPRGDVGGR